MKKTNTIPDYQIEEPKRRLSFRRLLLAMVLVAGIFYSSVEGIQWFQETQAQDTITPWFAPYVDVVSTPLFAFEQIHTNERQHNLVLSFIVSSLKDPCTPSWGIAYTMDEANVHLDLDRRIARFRQQDGTIAISFGGAINTELAIKCEDEQKLKQAYLDVINRYGIDTIDFDIEGDALKDIPSQQRRATVIAELQKTLRSQQKELAVWLTLPVSTQGFTSEGAQAVTEMLQAGVDIAGINVMTMNYGDTKEKTQTMLDASEEALNETHRQLGIIFKQQGIYLNDASLWKKIGATPMIGQNDIPGEVFTLDDAEGLNKFVTARNITRLSMWSANRDIQCGENYVNVTNVSDSCSGIKQEKYDFNTLLGKGFTGNIQSNASIVTKEDTEEQLGPDKPEESPYQIWNQTGTYLAGTKVVWNRNVYQAKWWTQGDLPDNPVLQSWETPWQLLGPVLPGEKPIPQPTLPEGTYPEWSGNDIYDVGQRVLLNGIPFQAKWWTEGDSPAASTANPDSSPWVMLTLEQVNEVIN